MSLPRQSWLSRRAVRHPGPPRRIPLQPATRRKSLREDCFRRPESCTLDATVVFGMVSEIRDLTRAR